MSADRRTFLRGLLAAIGGGAAAVAAEAGDATPDAPEGTDAARLAWAIRTFGEDETAAVVCDLFAAGNFSVAETVRTLRRQARRAKRAADARARREAHAGDEVIYCGPLAIAADAWSRIIDRPTRGRTAHGRRVEVGTLTEDWCIYGTPATEDRDPETGAPTYADPILIPAGSRVLADCRHGRHDTMAAEVVRTATGETRLHLWTRQQAPEYTEALPVLAPANEDHGRVYETAAKRQTGLLGLPL